MMIKCTFLGGLSREMQSFGFNCMQHLIWKNNCKHNKHWKENPFLAFISHFQPRKSKSFKAAQQHLSEMKNKERRMKWSVYSEQTNPFSASANIDYRDLKHLKDLLKQTLTRKEGEWPGVSTGQVVLDWRLFAWAAIVIIRLLRLEVLHHSAQRAYKPKTRMSVCKIYMVWFNFQTFRVISVPLA